MTASRRGLQQADSWAARWPTSALVLVHGQEAHDAWVRVARALPWVAERALEFAVVTGDPQATVAERRERQPDAKIGYIAADEESVLEALIGGVEQRP